jgi:tRNA nucleotidyltransferase (CCA-adding enzyme)
MEAGSITITPDDSLEKLQYLMSSTGWGQVPVVDPGNRQVVGIVTRTDLLKALAGTNSDEHKINLAAELGNTLSQSRLAIIKSISSCAAENNLPIYLVGGLVRDILLKRTGQDLDFVIEGDAIQLAKALAAKYGGRVLIHHQFGTAKWVIRSGDDVLLSPLLVTANNPSELPVAIDLISARTEFYSFPTALPTVKQGSIKLDLQRRDFTINTMAIRLDGSHYGELVDYWGGMEDLKDRLIRVLHSLSFVDDPTRVLRAIRFEQRLNFQLEERTKNLLMEASGLLEQVSGDRIRHELDLVIDGDRSGEILNRLQELDLLKFIHPDLLWDQRNKEKLELALNDPIPKKWEIPPSIANIPAHRFMAYLVIFSSVPISQVNHFSKRLKLATMLRTALMQSNGLMAEFPHLIHAKPSKVVKHLEKSMPIVRYTLGLMAPDTRWKEVIQDYETKWRLIKPFSDGETLKKMGLIPSPAYHKILFQLRAAWLDKEIHTKGEEINLLKEFINDLHHET